MASLSIAALNPPAFQKSPGATFWRNGVEFNSVPYNGPCSPGHGSGIFTYGPDGDYTFYEYANIFVESPPSSPSYSPQPTYPEPEPAHQPPKQSHNWDEASAHAEDRNSREAASSKKRRREQMDMFEEAGALFERLDKEQQRMFIRACHRGMD